MVLGVSGKIKCGKNEFYSHISKLMQKDGFSCEEFSFAHNLKIISAQLFGIEYNKEKDREFKEDVFVDLCSFQVYDRGFVEANRHLFDYVYETHDINMFSIDYESELKYTLATSWDCDEEKPKIIIPMRIWLQFFGTNVCRDFIRDIWVNSTMQSTNKIGNNYFSTDVRFPNEASAIKRKGGIVIRIERDCCNNLPIEHDSEKGLDTYEGFDYVIKNNGTLEEFHKSIEQFYQKIKSQFEL